MTGKILVIEDEENIRFLIVEALRKRGYAVEAVDRAEDGLDRIELFSPDLIITDIRLPGMSGLEGMNKIKKIDPYIPVIVITAFGKEEVALEAIKMGAYDFFTKPCKLSEMEIVVRRAMEKSRLQRRLLEMQEKLNENHQIENIIGHSGRMQEVMRLIKKVAPTDATVLIIGESGTGKELVGEAIHSMSLRKDKPLIKLNCAAIPDGLLESELFGHEKGAFTGAICRKAGKFELAHGGTLFLDEVGDMSPESQAKVLRILQDKILVRVGGTESISVDVRIIAATNKVLSQEVKKGRFREDLFYRLNVFPIVLPPLRERKEDISLLVEHFIEKTAKKIGLSVKRLSKSAFDCLQRHDWPGNIRELENVIERAMIMSEGDIITPAHLPAYLLSPCLPGKTSSLDQLIGDIERNFIIDALRKTGWVQSKAARILGISERSLWHRVKKYRIDIPK